MAPETRRARVQAPPGGFSESWICPTWPGVPARVPVPQCQAATAVPRPSIATWGSPTFWRGSESACTGPQRPAAVSSRARTT